MSLAVLTLGIVLGLASLALDGGAFDAAMTVTFAAWGGYACFLVLRAKALLHGRRSARASVLAFLVVVIVLPLTHFA